MRELARALGAHVRTIQTWYHNGMTPINPGERPLLFLGSEVRRFVGDRRRASRCPLQPAEFYCPKCRTARQSNPRNVRIELDGRRIGRDDQFALIKGKCTTCNCTLTRFTTRKRLQGSVWAAILAGCDARLWGTAANRVETDLRTGGHHAS